MLVILGIAAGATGAGGQEGGATAPGPLQGPPCPAPEMQQFQFWVGEWDVRWEQDGQKASGTNRIRTILGGCVLHEDFQGGGSEPLNGWSVSTYDRLARKWKQTWVDNSGAYLDFTGEFRDGKMILGREATGADGKNFLQRMVWYNITGKAFDWNWERSTDGGKTWTLVWKIAYTRRA